MLFGIYVYMAEAGQSRSWFYSGNGMMVINILDMAMLRRMNLGTSCGIRCIMTVHMRGTKAISWFGEGESLKRSTSLMPSTNGADGIRVDLSRPASRKIFITP